MVMLLVIWYLLYRIKYGSWFAVVIISNGKFLNIVIVLSPFYTSLEFKKYTLILIQLILIIYILGFITIVQ